MKFAERNMMNKKLLALITLCFGCGTAAESAEDFGRTEDTEPVGSTAQPITLETAYGVQKGPGGNPQMGCLTGIPSDCMVPGKKTIEVRVTLDSVASAADRDAISTALASALQTAKDGDDGFTWQSFSRTGFPPAGENACDLLVQQSFTPVTTAANDIRKYVGGNTYTTLVDFGTHSTFRTMVARADWNGLKAHRGVTGTCTSANPGPCVAAARKMILAFMANCAGVGFTSNSAADNTGNDLEANTVAAFLAGPGDLCRMKKYGTQSDSGRLIPLFPTCPP